MLLPDGPGPLRTPSYKQSDAGLLPFLTTSAKLNKPPATTSSSPLTHPKLTSISIQQQNVDMAQPSTRPEPRVSGLRSIPTEIKLEIFECLAETSPVTLLALALTCHDLFSIYTANELSLFSKIPRSPELGRPIIFAAIAVSRQFHYLIDADYDSNWSTFHDFQTTAAMSGKDWVGLVRTSLLIDICTTELVVRLRPYHIQGVPIRRDMLKRALYCELLLSTVEADPRRFGGRRLQAEEFTKGWFSYVKPARSWEDVIAVETFKMLREEKASAEEPLETWLDACAFAKNAKLADLWAIFCRVDSVDGKRYGKGRLQARIEQIKEHGSVNDVFEEAGSSITAGIDVPRWQCTNYSNGLKVWVERYLWEATTILFLLMPVAFVLTLYYG